MTGLRQTVRGRCRQWLTLVGVNVLVVSLSAACGVINPAASSSASDPAALPVGADTAAVVAATPKPARRVGPQTVPVTRDSIAETLTLDGVVVAREQEPITFSGRANVAAVLVKQGDSVKQGDALLELEAPHHVSAATLATQLDTARARLKSAETNLAEVQAQLASPQPSAAELTAATRQREAIAEATAALRQAQDNLATVQAGAPSADRQTAQDGVDAAQLVLQTAQDGFDKLSAGPDEVAMRAAQRNVTNAQIVVAKAQAGLDALTRGPDPTAIREAQSQLQRAQTQLQITQAAKLDPKADQTLARMQHDQAISDAELAVQTIQDRITNLKLPPLDIDVKGAKQSLQDAQDSLASANEALASLEAGPDEAALNAAQAVVDRAQQGLQAAEARAADVNGRPTRTELAAAQDRVRKAQAALDNSNQPLIPAPDVAATRVNAYLQAVLDTRAEIESLESALEKTSLVAPFDGTIVSVSTKPGAIITSTVTLFTVARPGLPRIHVDITDADAVRLDVGQRAAAVFENLSAPLPATVEAVTTAALDGSSDASADVKVDWPDGVAPAFGTPAQVNVTVQQKQGALLVPKAAVRRAGARATVEVQDGTLRRIVSVQVGIVSADRAEILSGLSEGQMVLAPPAS